VKIGIDYTSASRQRAGIGRYTRALVNALAQVDAQNHYALMVPNDGHLDGYTFPQNFRINRAPLSEHTLVTLWQRARLPLPVERFVGECDVFYSPDFVLPPTSAKKKILTVHDLSFCRVPETAVPNLKWYLEGAVPRAVKRADLILADSDATREDLVELFGVRANRVQTLYSGVEDFFKPVTDDATLARVRAYYALSKPFILSVGTIEPRKNFARLIEAYAKLPQHKEFDLLIAGGKGWMYDEIYAAPEKFGVAENVVFLGFVPDADLPALYSLCSLFVYPSLYEGFGLPVLEALACGAPTVTSDNSSMPEVAGGAALLVDARDTGALTDAMLRVLDDENLHADLARRGLEQSKKFSWEASARQLQAAFES
jgi:glycosyltransferase involved in cell wall biosynthesis